MHPVTSTDLKTRTYTSDGGVEITRTIEPLPLDGALDQALGRIDGHRGAIFASGYEYPGRYSRWDIGFVDPPIELVARQRAFVLRALNGRGQLLLQIFRAGLEGHPHLAGLEEADGELRGTIAPMPDYFPRRGAQQTALHFQRPARPGGADAGPPG